MRDAVIAFPQERTFAARLEERLLVPTYGSRWRFAPIAAHRGLAFPLQLTGDVHRWELDDPPGLRVLGIGRPKLIEPICAQLFGRLPRPVRQPRRAVWNPAELARSDVEMVIAEVHRWLAPRFQSRGWILIPSAVRWQNDLASVPPRNPSRSLLRDLRKARGHGFTIEHSTAAADWDEFYQTMVQPQALARHGPSAWLPSPEFLRALARGGTLHFVLQAGRRVAGLCSVGAGETLWAPLAGVRDGDPAWLRQGAAIAGLLMTLEWARSRGYRRLDLGRTGPFTSDGIQHYKRKWGLLPAIDPLAHVAAVWPGSDAVRQAFAREPVLAEEGSGLRVYAGESE